MQAAQHLYENLGFSDIDAYRHNPHEARYLELELTPVDIGGPDQGETSPQEEAALRHHEDISLRPVSAPDLPTIDRWAVLVAGHLSRARPFAEGADHHDPGSGLYWYVIVEAGLDVGTVWIELPAGDSGAVLGVFLADSSFFGRGIGAAAIALAIAEFRREHRHVPIGLRVRRSNARAIACYRRVGFTVTCSGSRSLPSGEVVPYYRMTRLP